MKIKCPSCKRKLEAEKLRHHLLEHDIFFLVGAYALLYIKIHKQMELHETIYDDNKGIVELLKSLLENEK